ncbi:MAG: alanine racemase, partial [Staphylococcus epidermidis]|nr:alanine racemase [Staphylococcus epidermidis]MDU3213590.1 alanine racemase [Staphylococcus epidermidis]
INDLRIGEALLRGIDTTTNHSINSLYQNAIVLEAEIIEIKPRLYQKNNQSYLQAIVDIGYLDTFIEGIKPLGNDIRILGASSDHLMIDLNNQDHYQIGDKLQFSLNYEALSQSMYMKNLTKLYSSDSKIESLVQNFDMPIYSQC